jgi:hypothetical protein
LYLSKESEEDPDSQELLFVSDEPRTFYSEAKKNLNHIVNALMLPEIYLVIAFFIISSVFSPDFGDFNYYFLLNEVKLTKFQYSMLGIVG